MENRFPNVFFARCTSWLYCKFCPWTPRRRFAVPADVSSVCDVGIRGRDRDPEQTEQCLECMAPNHISSNRLSTVIYREKNQHKKNKEALLYYVICSKKHPLTLKFCAPVLGPRFTHEIIIKNTKRNMWKYVWKSIPHTFKMYLKIVHFLGTVLL